MKWSRTLIILGGIAMVVGAVDPLEGSLLILPGSALVAFGAYLGSNPRNPFRYEVWAFILIAIGVGALWGFSAIGGIGEGTGYSIWWVLVFLPYPIGWIMDMARLGARLIRFVRMRGRRVPA